MYDILMDSLLKQYGIDVLDMEKLNDNLDLAVKGILTEKCAGKKCALWGAGRMNTTSSHAAILIGKYATYLKNLVCVIDSDKELQGKTFLGFPIIAPERIHEFDLDIIIVSSKNSGASIAKCLYQVSPNSNYVDIYEELRIRGLEVYNNFYDEHSIYTELYDMKTQIDHSQDKKNIIKKIISLYLGIRDFYYGFYYIDLYVNERFDNWEKYKELKQAIFNLLNEIKEVNSKKTEDISLFYIDALRAVDILDEKTKEPKILKEYISHGQVYSNMYSTGTTTYESMVSAILGSYPLDCDVYSNNFLRTFEENEMLEHVNSKGFKINWMVSDCYRLMEEDPRLSFDIQVYMSLKLWRLSCALAESEEKTFNFIYFPYEIHCPMLCGYHKVKPVIRGFSNLGIEYYPESIMEQYKDCISYMDRQFEFYYYLLGAHTTKVIFSDHSQVVYDSVNNGKTYNMYYKYKDLTSHVPFIISNETLEPSLSHEYFSLININKIIISIVEKINFNNLSSEIIRYQYYPIHSAKIRLHAIEHDFHDYIDGIDVFVSEDYIYVKTGTGKEEVYLNDDLDKNIKDSMAGKKFIKLVHTKYNVAFN